MMNTTINSKGRRDLNPLQMSFKQNVTQNGKTNENVKKVYSIFHIRVFKRHPVFYICPTYVNILLLLFVWSFAEERGKCAKVSS